MAGQGRALNVRTQARGLPAVEQGRSIVFCDLDGTYLDHHPGIQETRDLRALEAYLQEHCASHGIIFGWVTGGVWRGVVRKFRDYDLALWPHFVASGLGTELHLVAENGDPVRDQPWSDLLRSSGFDRGKAARAVAQLARHGVPLPLQDQIQQGELKYSCYYFSENEHADQAKLAAIRETAREHGLAVKISRCGQGVGDPEDCYDVDFIPPGAGKGEIVRYLLERYGLSPLQALAFGDSGNDLEVLNQAQHGYLVSNADPAAKQAFGKQTPAPYAAGVLWGLRKFASN